MKPVSPAAETAVEKDEKKSELEMAFELSSKVREVLERYVDPIRTDTVSADDWRLVFQTAQLGQLQGYTAVQIEAQRWFASGQIELSKNDYPNAFTAFNKATDFMPSSALPYYGLGNTYFANKQLSDALKSYQRAVQLDPKLAMPYKKLGDTQRMLGNEKEAITSYTLAIKLGYRTTETRYWLGILLLETKQIEDGIRELEEVARQAPTADLFISIGSGYEKLKRDVSALESYQKAIKADPASAVAYYRLGNVYYEQREYGKAKEALEKAMEIDTEGKILNRTEVEKKLRETSSKINR